MKFICVRNAWGDGVKPEQSIVPELLLPFEKVKQALDHLDILIRETSQMPMGIEPDAVIFIDCPALEDPLYQYCVVEKIPFILLITENLYLQPNSTYPTVGRYATRILSYEDNPPFPWKTDKFRYPGVPSSLPSTLGMYDHDVRPYLVGMINSAKCGGAPGELYSKRSYFAAQFSQVGGMQFALHGMGWPACPSNRGPLPRSLSSKYEAYSQCEFALVMENNGSIPGYTTEKIFNALLAGCIPIYQYCDNGEIPNDCFIDAGAFNTPVALWYRLRTMGAAEKERYRVMGVEFLFSNKGQLFSEAVYFKQLVSTIRGLV